MRRRRVRKRPAPVAEPEPPAEIAARVDYAPEVHAEAQPETAAVASESEAAQIQAEEVVATSYTSAEVETEEAPRTFGESKFGESGLGGSSYHFSDDAHGEIHEAVMDNGGNERGEEAPAAISSQRRRRHSRLQPRFPSRPRKRLSTSRSWRPRVLRKHCRPSRSLSRLLLRILRRR